MQVTIPEARSRLSQLIRSVQAGAEVVIAEDGEPVARLVPVADAPGTTIATGRASAILDWLTRRPLPSGVRRSAEEIDAAIEAERASWD
jgi:prevent-host-death family protein